MEQMNEQVFHYENALGEEVTVTVQYNNPARARELLIHANAVAMQSLWREDHRDD
jgi:hypothetical protein